MTTIQIIGRFLTKAFVCFSLGVVLLFFLFVVGSMGYDYATRIPFNSSEWKAGKKGWEKDELRGRMVADLTSRYDLYGMERDELIELLGKPDEEVGLGVWDMGWVTGLSWIDPLWFVVRLSGSDRVEEYDTNVNFG